MADGTALQGSYIDTKSSVISNSGGDVVTSLDAFIDKSPAGNDWRPHKVTTDTPIFGTTHGYTSRRLTGGTSDLDIGYFEVPFAFSLTDYLSISYGIWVNVDDFTAGHNVVSNPNGKTWAASYARFRLAINSVGTISAAFNNASTVFTTIDTISAAANHFLVVTWDGSSVGIYIDGVLDSGGVQSYVHGIIGGTNSENGIVFGNRSRSDPSAAVEFRGRMQDFWLFKNRVLTSTDISDIYAEQNPAGVGQQRNLKEFFDLTDCVLNVRM